MHPSGFEVQLAQPLDFYAVTDHASMLGLVNEAADTDTAFSEYELSKSYHGINDSVDGGLFDLAKRNLIFNNFRSDVVASLLDGTFNSDVINSVSKSGWTKTVDAANEAYRPGQFTTFAAYEYTPSTEELGNLHRNVVFRGTDKLPAVPFSRLNSSNPEGLWRWMDGLRKQGIESLAIPHNSNGSNGAMFAFTDWAGNAIDQEYAEQRMRNEPLVEITQVKGTSDTHPLLSPNDEWAISKSTPSALPQPCPALPRVATYAMRGSGALPLRQTITATPTSLASSVPAIPTRQPRHWKRTITSAKSALWTPPQNGEAQYPQAFSMEP